MACHSARARGSSQPISAFSPARSLSRSTSRRLVRIPASVKCVARRIFLGVVGTVPDRKHITDWFLPRETSPVALDSPLEGSGFELLVPLVDAGLFGRTGRNNESSRT